MAIMWFTKNGWSVGLLGRKGQMDGHCWVRKSSCMDGHEWREELMEEG